MFLKFLNKSVTYSSSSTFRLWFCAFSENRSFE